MKVLEDKAITGGLKELDWKWHSQNPQMKVDSSSLEVVRLLNLVDSIFFFFNCKLMLAFFVNIIFFLSL